VLRAAVLVALLVLTACTGGGPSPRQPAASPSAAVVSGSAQPVAVDEPRWRAHLRAQLEADPRVVRAMLLAARPSGLFQCAVRLVGSERHGAVRYGKVRCGDYRTGPDAVETRGGSLAAVLRLSGSPGHRCLARIEFPDQATLDQDMQRLFPPDVLDDVRRLDLLASRPSDDELLAVARSRPPGFVSAVGRPGAPCR